MMTKACWITVILGLSATLALAKVTKEFPAHWGQPPQIQTKDYVELPDGYGHGSSTLKHWINGNLAKDRAGAGTPQPPAGKELYRQDFQKFEAGAVPDELLVLAGDFTVKVEGTNHFLELPGAPLDSFGAQFGPTERENVMVTARILSTSKGRRAPTFGVGLNGVAGFKLQVSPAKKALEILKDQEVAASLPFDWKSAEWTQLRLEVRKLKDGAWKISGKAWQSGEEPVAWTITHDETEEPIPGRASVLGSPFAGTPIWFDDLTVSALAAQGASAAR